METAAVTKEIAKATQASSFQAKAIAEIVGELVGEFKDTNLQLMTSMDGIYNLMLQAKATVGSASVTVSKSTRRNRISCV